MDRFYILFITSTSPAIAELCYKLIGSDYCFHASKIKINTLCLAH